MARCLRLFLSSSLLPRSQLLAPARQSQQPLAARGFSMTSKLTQEQIEELKKNPFFDKYAEKIAKLQNTSPEEFLGRLSAQEEYRRPRSGGSEDTARDFSLPGRARSPCRGREAKADKSLASVLKLELLEDRTAEEIAAIWSQHFVAKDTIAAVIPTETYKVMQQRFKEFSTFLFPLPRKAGYEFVMVQFLGNEAHFTTLINYQAHRENAPECLSLVHYTELMDSKGIVLMAGEYDKNTLDPIEAKCLADQVEIYYSRPSEKKLEIMRKFTHQPAYFHHKELIEEMNSLAIQ